MLNSLLLIIVMILTLFLAFYCVDSHKKDILAMVNTDKKSIKLVSVNVEENLSKEAVKVVNPIEKVYVEVLAKEEQNESQAVIETVEPAPVKVEVKTVIEEEVSVKTKQELSTKDKKTSEYSKGYELDDLEKMIREELKKGNKE